MRQQHFQRISKSSELIPDIKWHYSEAFIIQEMKYICGKKPNIETCKKKLPEFCLKLDQLELKEVPHGDICKRNILEDSVKLYLVDIEPILEFPCSSAGVYFVSTPHVIHEFDMDNQRISIRSDLLGFAYFVFWCHDSLHLIDKQRRDQLQKFINLCAIKIDPFQELFGSLLDSDFKCAAK